MDRGLRNRLRRICGGCFSASLPFSLGLLLASPCEAQIVVGHLLESGTRAPVEGALVILVREWGEEEDGYLTNSAGRFRLRATSTGRFRVRAERIGYETVVSAPFELTAGQVYGMELEISSAPITLEGIDIEGEQKCVVRPEEGLALAQLWEEAQKALRIQDWTEREGLYEYQVSNYRRELGPEAQVVEAETRETESVVARLPYQSAPVEDLLTHGFIRALEDGRFEFYAPDASALLSDSFLDTHCFRMTEDSRLPESIGLSFEPTKDSQLPDIEGVLWLDRASARLQSLEYQYTKEPYRGGKGTAGGRVDFEALGNGAWIVRKWAIRVPKIQDFRWPGIRALSERRVIGFSETGGAVLQAYSGDQLVLRETPQGILSGIVWDSIRGQPLAGATVALSGISRETVTDSAGRFSMMELPEGVYTATVAHTLLDSLGVLLPGERVEITRDQLTEVGLAIPSMETLLATICQGEEEDFRSSALVGTVLDARSGEPIPKATVTVKWAVSPGAELWITGSAQASTDMNGRYVLCGLPPDQSLTVRASFMEQARDTTVSRAGDDSHVVANFALELPPGTLVFRTSTEALPPPREQQGIQGSVVDPISGRPVSGAEITLRRAQGDLTRTETTNARGFFRISSPWLGTFTLEATALGYKPVRSDSVEIEPGELTVVEIEMPAEPLALDPVVVVAESRDFQLETSGFYQRVEEGFGHFITPEIIESHPALEVSDLLRGVPGLILERTTFGTKVSFRTPSIREDSCAPRVYVDGVLVSQPSPFDEPSLFIDDLPVSVGEIVGIEVHTRSTGIPLVYGGSQGSCGVVLIWTKGG